MTISWLFRGVAQPGSAHVWGACGRWFKSSHPDFVARGAALGAAARGLRAACPSLADPSACLLTSRSWQDLLGFWVENGIKNRPTFVGKFN